MPTIICHQSLYPIYNNQFLQHRNATYEPQIFEACSVSASSRATLLV
jgi:hypothetical protein